MKIQISISKDCLSGVFDIEFHRVDLSKFDNKTIQTIITSALIGELSKHYFCPFVSISIDRVSSKTAKGRFRVYNS